VAIRDLSFGYAPENPVLHDLNLKIPAGGFYGIVGHTGSGKSTLLSLLLRFYHAQSGTITIDDLPLAEIGDTAFRERVGLVPQDPFLLAASARENIAMGRAISNAEIEAAARAAKAHEFICALEDGYDTPLGEGTTAFASFSEHGNLRRARNGGRAVTLSTHTDVTRWERAYRDGTEPALRAVYRNRLLAALDRLIPGASKAATLIECGTPHTFASYTSRYRGLVGGLPQTPSTAVLGAFGHATPLAGLYHCGDTAFPGQSTVGASLSAINAANAALFWRGVSPPRYHVEPQP